MNRYAMYVLGALLAFTLAACGGGGGVATVTNVTIDGGDRSIAVGATQTLEATVVVTGGASRAVTWSTSDASIVSVSGNGTIVGVAPGSAEITATSSVDPARADTITVTVTETTGVTGVTVTPASASVAVGATVTLSASVQGSGVSQDVVWTSSNTAVATVDAGLVTGVSAGTAIVTATSVADATQSGSATVTVTGDDQITVVCDGSAVISENITTATTITPDCYRVTTNVTVSAPLTIEPGTVLEFTTNAGLRIGAGSTLRAEGTAANPIRLTSVSRDPNDWNGVGIFTSSDNVLDHVVIENAGRRATVINGFNYANFYLDSNARVAITNSTFSDAGGGGNGVGVYVEAASAELVAFAGNTFARNGLAAMRITAQQVGQIGAGNQFGVDTLASARHIRVADSTIRASATWRAVDVPYRFFGNTIIEDPDATVTIEAGATLEFTSTAGLRLNAGTLRAEGTSAAGILFTSVSRNPNDWRGVGISSNSPDNSFTFVTLENAGVRNTEINGFNHAGLFVDGNSAIAVSDSTFRTTGDGGNGIYVEAASARFLAFDRNEFVANTGAPIRLFANQLDSIGSGNVFGTDAPFAGRFVEVRPVTVTTDQAWQNQDIPYRFFGSTFVNDPSATVTIEPGTTLQFASNAGLRVDAGVLRAIGTASDRITFTSGSANAGEWHGVGIASNNTQNALQFVTIENAGNRSTPINNFNGANLYVATTGRVAVTDSAFTDSTRWGIYIDGAGDVTNQAGTSIDPATQGNNTFDNNTSGNVRTP